MPVQILGYLAGPDHCVMFFGFCLLVFFHIYRFCLAVDTLDFGIGFDVCLTHLQRYQSSRQGYCTDIVPGTCFYSYYISFSQLQFVAVLIIPFAGILELNFNHFLFLGVAGNISQPVVGVQLLILSSAAFATQTAASVL